MRRWDCDTVVSVVEVRSDIAVISFTTIILLLFA